MESIAQREGPEKNVALSLPTRIISFEPSVIGMLGNSLPHGMGLVSSLFVLIHPKDKKEQRKGPTLS
uniref:Uncharacterized protein n=1 Tax=Parascaris equorum TaxID=6256 RepID=A0A914RIR0_PAREQ